jgi:hypothetical protein
MSTTSRLAAMLLSFGCCTAGCSQPTMPVHNARETRHGGTPPAPPHDSSGPAVAEARPPGNGHSARGEGRQKADASESRSESAKQNELPGFKVGDKVSWEVDWDQGSYSKEHGSHIYKYIVRGRGPGHPESGIMVAVKPKASHGKMEFKDARLTGIFSGFIELPFVAVDPVTNEAKVGQGRLPFVTEGVIEARR